MLTARRLIFPAVVLLAACYYPDPYAQPQVRWVDTPVGKAAAVGGAVRKPRVISQVNPAPTSSAGVVSARLVVGEDGTVRNVEITSASDNEAAASAKEALLRWKFAPTFAEGHAVPVVTEVKITFKAPTG